jgi:hypothetical protein
MLIPGIPVADLERIHWRHGGGRGTVGFRHKPSGITVERECPSDVPVRCCDEAALAQLVRELRERGLLADRAQTSAGASPDGGGGV